MTTSVSTPVVDADGHVLEPADTWLKYLTRLPRSRHPHRAGRAGYEVLLIDGQPLRTLRGQLGRARRASAWTPRGCSRGPDDLRRGSPPGGYDPVERLRVMDGEGSTPCCSIPPSASAGRATSPTARWPRPTRARTTAGSPSSAAPIPKRLYPVAHISLLDPEGAVEETIRARRDGCVGIFLSPDLAARGGRHFDDPLFARFWETAQELEMPIAFHVVVRDRQWFRQWQRAIPSTRCSASRSWPST
jgi:hypothetical protein